MRKTNDKKVEEILKDGLAYAVGGGDPYFRSYSMAMKRAEEAENMGKRKEAQIIRDLVLKYVEEENKDLKNMKRVFECETCHTDNSKVKLFRCSRCKKVRYCSQRCQKIDWKEHKSICGERKSKIEAGGRIRHIFQIAPSQSSIFDENRLLAPFFFTYDVENLKVDGDDYRSSEFPTPEKIDSTLFFIITGIKIRKIKRKDMKYLKRIFDLGRDKVNKVEYLHFSKAFECPLCEEVCMKEGIVLVENMKRMRIVEKEDRFEIRTRNFPRITHQKCLEQCVLYNCWADPVFQYDKFVELEGMCFVWDLILPDSDIISKTWIKASQNINNIRV